ncbi:hypothetical protein PR202_gb12877 [Eleusine coracana subsp. coracana]|uniref:Protein kinase domain-containing protein n=1 Tax=Eleusine coracana subsp. coracana TaxID=191504 RepID=A0AAV5ES64_ELECO|nr:hypothetical protein PR202_gb12877 [Eleusine coracana subsp. coracana]
MFRFDFPVLPRAAAIPQSRAELSLRFRPLEPDLGFRVMDALVWPPSSGKDDSPESSAAAATRRPSSGSGTKISPSVLLLTSISASDPLCVQVDAVAAAEPPINPNLGATAAEKRGISGEYELEAARLRRRRFRAAPVIAAEGEAPFASPTKSSPCASRNAAAPLSDRNPNIAAAAASSFVPKKPDHLCSEPGATNTAKKSGSGHGAAAAKDSDHHGGGGEQGAAKSSGSAPGAAAAAGGGALRIGSLSSYERIAVLGEGGFGTVFEAKDTRTGELVAIKSTIESRKEERDGGAALLREAALLAACRGIPAVVSLREIVRGPGAEDDVHIVMDRLGPSLHEMLHCRGPLTEPETRRIMRQLLTAVEAIVHGDLKPENVLIGKGPDGHVIYVICDFGLSVFVSEPRGNIPGTLHYAAPEQLLNEECGPPVDAWALGCVMGELLTGKPLVEECCEVLQWTRTVLFFGVSDEVSLMNNGFDHSTPSKLRGSVPEVVLSPDGFDVLFGLLCYNPNDRLTPAAALQMPWLALQEEEAE